MNSSKACCVTTLSICNLVACRPSCVCYCCCYKCCSKCYKCCGLTMVSIQFSYTFASKCRCSSPFENLVSCSLGYLSHGDVICGTFYFCSFSYVSYGVVICGILKSVWLRVPLLTLHMVPLYPHPFLCPHIYALLFPFHF
jgi:hypothetical protein